MKAVDARRREGYSLRIVNLFCRYMQCCVIV